LPVHVNVKTLSFKTTPLPKGKLYFSLFPCDPKGSPLISPPHFDVDFSKSRELTPNVKITMEQLSETFAFVIQSSGAFSNTNHAMALIKLNDLQRDTQVDLLDIPLLDPQKGNIRVGMVELEIVLVSLKTLFYQHAAFFNFTEISFTRRLATTGTTVILFGNLLTSSTSADVESWLGIIAYIIDFCKIHEKMFELIDVHTQWFQRNFPALRITVKFHPQYVEEAKAALPHFKFLPNTTNSNPSPMLFIVDQNYKSSTVIGQPDLDQSNPGIQVKLFYSLNQQPNQIGIMMGSTGLISPPYAFSNNLSTHSWCDFYKDRIDIISKDLTLRIRATDVQHIFDMGSFNVVWYKMKQTGNNESGRVLSSQSQLQQGSHQQQNKEEEKPLQESF